MRPSNKNVSSPLLTGEDRAFAISGGFVGQEQLDGGRSSGRNSVCDWRQGDGQDSVSQQRYDDDIKLFRKDVRSLKKQIIAANLELTDAEAEQFWPIYNRYTAELSAICETKYTLISEYAQNYTTLTGPQADHYLDERAAAEEATMQLRLKYIRICRKVLSGKSTALFFELDWRLGLVMELHLASQTPLIEP